MALAAVPLAVMGAIAYGLWSVDWSHVGDAVGIKPSPTRFVEKYRDNSNAALDEYALATSAEAKAMWSAVMSEIPKDAEIFGHKYVFTVWPETDVTQKTDLYLVKFNKGDKKDFVLIGADRAKDGKFVPGFMYLFDKDVANEVKKVMAEE